MTRSTSEVAACCSRASFKSRVSRATFVSLPAAGELQRWTVFGVLRRSGAAVLRGRVLTGSLAALERRFIASPEAQDKASCRFKLAHWERPGAVLCVTANFDRECPLWVKSGHCIAVFRRRNLRPCDREHSIAAAWPYGAEMPTPLTSVSSCGSGAPAV